MIFKILAVYGSREGKFEFHGELFRVDKCTNLWIMVQLQLLIIVTFIVIRVQK